MHYSELNYTKEDVILLLLKNFNYTSTSTKWDQYVGGRKKQILPYSRDILNVLDVKCWNDVRKLIEHEWHHHELLKDAQDLKSKKDILSIEFKKMLIRKQVNPYKEHLTSSQTYMKFRKEHPELELPHFQNIIAVFGSWNEFKKELGLETHQIGRLPKYSYQELVDILKENKEYFTDANTWNEHAEKHNLPSMQYMRNRIPIDIIQQYTDYAKWYDYSISYILETIYKHKEAFMKGKNHWERYATQHSLPHYHTIINKIGKGNVERIKKGEYLTVADVEKYPF